MSDEAVLIVAILGGIAALAVALVWRLRRKEARLAALAEIEIPILSTFKSVLVIVPFMVVGPVLVGVVGALTDPWARHHALAATLVGIGLGVGGMLVGWRLSRRLCRIGLLRCTPARLELEVDGQQRYIDLDQPFELDEGLAFGPANMSLQVLWVSQGDDGWGFSYGLPLGRKAYGDRSFDRYVTPLVDGEARVVHDRLRRRLTSGLRPGSGRAGSG